MDIRDAVAAVIYRDAIARPERYPEGVTRWATEVARLQKDCPKLWTMPALCDMSGTWQGFRESLVEYSGQLPEICTENE